MLDLVKLRAQVGDLSRHLSQEATANQQRLQKALLVFDQLCDHPQAWQDRYDQWQQQLIFSPATPAESLDQFRIDQTYTWPTQSPQTGIHSVVATDGSQIVPSHHEIAYCSLINVGRVVLHYGRSQWPNLDSVPVLFYRSQDLRRGQGVGVEEMLSLRRTQSEVEELVQLALSHHSEAPLLALVDGSLIHWTLDALPVEDQIIWLEPILKAYDQLQKSRIPIVGYISASRSSEVINYFRLGLCPYLSCECHYHCADAEILPCNPFRPLSDRAFWSALLSPGQRSPIWRSGARLLQHYRSHHIHACYLHVGEEVARIEFPAWVATDGELLDQAIQILLAQVQKGFGYPIALAEAHHLAVVRGGDRQRFFALVEQELIRAGLKNITVSRKEARKRGGIA